MSCPERAGAAALALATCLFCVPAAAGGLYRLESAVALAGLAPEWDYVTLDPARPHLFIGRRGGGITVFDTAPHTAIATIERSQGADAAALVPEFDRGYTANEDGSTTIFRLSTLRTTDRVSVGTDNDSAFFDPVTKQLVFTQGDSHQLVFMDAASGHKLGTLNMDSHKLDGAAPDGRGGMFIAERDRGRVARIDVAARRVTAIWPVPGCEQPTGLAFDAAGNRIFVGCRGASPVLAVLDAGSGREVSAPPIGRGNDGVVFDAATHQVFTSNGVDANLVIYRQVNPDRYELVEATTTRPYARTMALDHASGKIYSVTAEGAADPARKINVAVAPFYPNIYFDNTFTVLTFARR